MRSWPPERRPKPYFKGASKKLDDRLVDVFKKNNVEVITLTPEEFDAWVNLAKQSSYKVFSDEVPDGKKLIDDALAVK
jgi:TRAP-type C4-dicarboxylate transport system substrate-binding protein